jgi:hypothetical protein
LGGTASASGATSAIRICNPLHPEELLVWQCAQRAKVPDVFMPHVADNDYVVQLQEWLMREGLTYPSMPMEGAHPNYFTINGKAYPATDTIHMALGETLKVRR